MHQLDGAYERINGAREHLDALKPEISAFTKVVANDVSLKYRKGVVTIKGRKLEVPIGTASFPINLPTPPRLSRLIGEIIQNLRIALDYLTYEMTCYDAKSVVDNTQFPIADKEEVFKSNLHRYNLLGNLSAYHITMIERLQLYKGCNWTKLLRDLSNPDKHRHLTAIKHPIAMSLNTSNTDAILAGKQVDVDSYTSIKIAFSNGPPVVEGLEQLMLDVTQTLDVFKPEFER